MDKINIQILTVIIILAVIGWFVVRAIMRKNKREELFKVTKANYENIKKLYIDSGEALERAEQIAKTDDEIKLFNTWYKEYKDLDIRLKDLEADYQETYKAFEKSKHKDFIETNKSLGFKIDELKEKIEFLHQRLFNYTSYELENTQIALDLKTSIKEVQNGFEVNLAVKEIYTPSFTAECEKVEHELMRFEDKQKLGEYTKARKHLKNASELTNKLEYNYAIITNISQLCEKLETNISIIDQVSSKICERKFRLDQDEYLQNYDELKIQKAQIVKEVDEADFTEKISEDFVNRKEREIAEIEDSIFNIKQSIEEQYAQIKVIEEHISANEQLFEQSEELITGALEERNEINILYQMPEDKAILKLETEITRYNQFKKDYEILLDLVYDLKEDYQTLASRVAKSNEFIKHFIANMQKSIEGLKEIRTDEIKALEHIGEYKQKVTVVELYLSHAEHIHQMSRPLTALLGEAYAKIDKLNKMLDNTPLNITEVRRLTHASESLLADLEKQAENEIETKYQAQTLIKFSNRFVEDNKSQDHLSHAMTLYNTQNYETVVNEIKQSIYNDFENPEQLYKQIIAGCSFQKISEYKKEM